MYFFLCRQISGEFIIVQLPFSILTQISVQTKIINRIASKINQPIGNYSPAICAK